MNLNKELLNQLIDVTSNAAIACYPHIGKKDKILADKATTDNMRKNLNNLDIKGLPEVNLNDVKLLPVIPNPGKIFCIGLNYENHTQHQPVLISNQVQLKKQFHQ